MILSAAKAKQKFSALFNCISEMRNLFVSNEEWDKEIRICNFLRTAYGIKENQSGCIYVTISYSVLVEDVNLNQMHSSGLLFDTYASLQKL